MARTVLEDSVKGYHESGYCSRPFIGNSYMVRRLFLALTSADCPKGQLTVVFLPGGLLHMSEQLHTKAKREAHG